jgi:ketosteroid isomerase-like protein
MNLELNKKKVADFFSRFATKDIAGAMSMTSDQFTWWIGGKKELFPMAGVKTKAEMTALLENMLDRMQTGLTITPKAMIAEGDKVAVEAESYGVAGDGGIYNNEYHFLVVVRDGVIEEIKEYLDTMHTAHVFLR